MMRFKSRYRVTHIASVLAAFAVTAGVVGIEQGFAAPCWAQPETAGDVSCINAQPPYGEHMSVPSAGEAQTVLSSQYGVFRTDRTADDIPIVGSVGDATSPSQAGYADVDQEYVVNTGMRVGLSRRVRTTSRIFAIPANGTTCIVEGAGVATCTPNEYVGEDFQVQVCGYLQSGRVSVSGLVKDGVSGATVITKAGTRVSMHVFRNYASQIYTASAESDLPASVELVSSSRTTTHAVSSLDAEALTCDFSS
jgi:hypothetical protein